MNDFGEFDSKGVVLSNTEMRQQRRKRGECEQCGIKCFKKTLFKSIPITDHGNVLNGRCLRCFPIETEDDDEVEKTLPTQVTPENEKRLDTFARDDRMKRTRSLREHNIRNNISLRHLRKTASTGKILEETDMELISENQPSTYPTSPTEDSSTNHPTKPAVVSEAVPPTRMVNQAVGIAAALQLQRDFRARKAEAKKEKPIESSEVIADETTEKSSSQESDTYQESIDVLEMNESCSLLDVIGILQLYPLDQNIFHKATTRLSKADFTAVHIDEVTDGAIMILVSGMKSFGKERDIQFNTIVALFNICEQTKSKEMRIAIGSGLVPLVSAFDRFSKDLEIQQILMRLLCRLAETKENETHIMKADAVLRVVQAMANHSDNIELQESSCNLLQHLSLGDYPLKSAVFNAKGAPQIAVAMAIYPEDISFLKTAMKALHFLCDGHGEDTIQLVQSGAIVDAIVSSMHLHRDEIEIQQYGVSTLHALSYTFEAASIIGSSGGIDVIVRAMWVHPSDKDIQSWCCQAMNRLCIDMNNSALFVSIGGSSAIANTMQNFTDDPTLQGECCHILSKVGPVDEQIKIQLVEDEVIDGITLAMVLYGDNLHVQETACLALQSLACESTVDALLAANVTDLMSTAASTFPSQCRGPYDFMMSTINGIVEDGI